MQPNDDTRRFILSSDHAGAEAKHALSVFLHEQGYRHIALYGAETPDDRRDYPQCAAEAVKDVLADTENVGIFICGSGIGISIAANRFPGIRAALCHDSTSARLAREHNDANVLCLGARLLTPDSIRDCAATFLTTRFEGGRHADRVNQLDNLTI